VKAGLIVVVLAALALASPASARTEPVCWFTADPLTLNASGLPTTPFGVSFDPFPMTSTLTSIDGTFSMPVYRTPPLTAYFWQRGHGPSLLKPGPGLNDYHVIALCSEAS